MLQETADEAREMRRIAKDTREDTAIEGRKESKRRRARKTGSRGAMMEKNLRNWPKPCRECLTKLRRTSAGVRGILSRKRTGITKNESRDLKEERRKSRTMKESETGKRRILSAPL